LGCMEPGDLPVFLTELPFVGPLFTGSLPAVGLRLLGLVAVVLLGLKIMQMLLKAKAGPGGPIESVTSLAGQGRYEDAGDQAARDGEWGAALGHYERANVWVKAGHAARRLADPDKAGSCFEQAREWKLAAAAYEASSNMKALARVASQSSEPALLSKSAKWFASQGENLRAGELYTQANMLSDAERCYLAVPEQGIKRAAQMYLDVYEETAGGTSNLDRQRDLARKAAELLALSGDSAKARTLCHRAGLDAAKVLQDPAARGSARGLSRAGSGAGPAQPVARAGSAAPVAPGELAIIDGPLPSLDDIAAPTSARDTSDSAGSEDDLSIEAPLSSLDVFSAASPRSAAPEPTDARAATAMASPGAAVRNSTAMAAPDAAALAEATPRRPTTGIGPMSSDVTDRYEILEQLGEGGMGEVYKARDTNLGRLIAIKFLSPGLVGNEVAMKFFTREARAAAALNHPCIVTIYDFGILGGRPFISMEFIEGTDLSSRLEDQGPLQEAHAINVAIQVALALDYAHERSVIHRDIKPPNVIQARGGGVKILDFGLAKALHANKKGASIVAGTPDYMPPEQLAGGDMDGRTDIFSLGVTLYEILTGETPFEGILRPAEVDPPSIHAPWLTADIDGVVAKAISIDPDQRFQKGREMASALRRALKEASGS